MSLCMCMYGMVRRRAVDDRMGKRKRVREEEEEEKEKGMQQRKGWSES